MLLVIFGAPDQMPTILGLATAGLTVVFQDFILAFFGWFVLMGKNGIRVGDWVEINGVGGEVVEIGLFRTALLETGNWTDKGHPTGRRVTFINSFAITRAVLQLLDRGAVDVGRDQRECAGGRGRRYKTIEAIQKAVIEQTAKDTSQAEAEWKAATQKQQGLSQFSAQAFGGSAAGGVGDRYAGAVCDAGGGAVRDAEQAVLDGAGSAASACGGDPSHGG